jgi:predicted nucleotidyltransferase
MREHHQRAVDRLVAELGEDPRFLAVILGGSIVRGTELPDSDIDLILVASPEEYARRLPERDFGYLNREVCDYTGGYAEAKVMSLEFLEEIADRGSEPARSAFVGARILSSRIPALENLLERVTTYPEAERIPKIRSFYAHFLIHYWYLSEGQRRSEQYLVMRSAAEFALFAGRLILAHNRILFPYHKWFMHELRNATEKPDDLIDGLERLLREPCVENANPVLASVANFRDWEKPPRDAAAQFMEDSEWNWRQGLAPVADR